MTEVRKHQRRTASGKRTTVRRHTRDTGRGPGGDERRPAAEDAPPAPSARRLPPAEPREDAETWWDGDEAPREPWMDAGDDFHAAIDAGDEEAMEDAARRVRTEAGLGAMKNDMRHWRSLDVEVPRGEVDMSPLGRVLGNDTQEGADKFARLKAYREAGYDGPIDQDGNIPDPDDPAEREALHALAAMRVTR
jgi:hypothetical protein